MNRRARDPMFLVFLAVIVAACGTTSATGQRPSPVFPIAYVISATSASAWHADTGARVWQRPLIPGTATPQSFLAGATLFIADGALSAVRSRDGALLWTVTLPQSAQESVPVLIAGRVYLDTSTALYALRADTGALVWRYDHPVALPALVTDGTTLYLAANVVVALDATTGTTLWTTALAEGLYTTQAAQELTFAGTTLYARTQSDALFALDTKTGARRWVYQSPGGLSAPTLGPTAVYVTTSMAPPVAQVAGVPTVTVLALSSANGSTQWKTNVPAPNELDAGLPAPKLVRTTLYVLGGPTNGDVLALRAMDGSRLWDDLGIVPGSDLAADGEGVTKIGQDGSLWRLTTAGIVLWHQDGIPGPIALVEAAPPTYYVIWQSGQFAALGLATGHAQWQVMIPGGVQAPLLTLAESEP